MASGSLALELADMGMEVRRRSWPPDAYLRAHKPREWGGGEPPETLPGTEQITRYTPTEEDVSATDWEIA